MAINVLAAAVREAPPFRQVVHGPISFLAHCARHDETYFGRAFVGYVPTGSRLGPSALTRIVRQASRESGVADRIASILEVCVRPAGVAILVETTHHCTGLRVVADGGLAQRTVWRGHYQDDAALRSEFLTLCNSAR